MKEIILTQGMVAVVDNDVYESLCREKWYAQRVKNGWYAVTHRKNLHDGRKIAVLMHREILNAKSGQQIDHADRNGLNNQVSNLRICSQSENNANQSLRKNNTSGFKGVYWCGSARKWISKINQNGKRTIIGYFSDKMDAAKAYDNAALQHYDKFALTNEKLNQTNPWQRQTHLF